MHTYRPADRWLFSFQAGALAFRAFVAIALLGSVIAARASTDRFVWANVPASLQIKDQLFVKVEARSLNGLLESNFNNVVALSAVTREKPPGLLLSEVGLSGIEVCNVGDLPFSAANWTITLYDSTAWPSPRTVFTIPLGTVCAPRSVFSLRTGGTPGGIFPAFALGFNLGWSAVQNENPIAVLLRDSSGNVVDFFCAGGAYPVLVSDPIAVSESEWFGVPASLLQSFSLSYQRAGVLDHNSATDWTRTNSTLGILNPIMRFPFRGPLREIPLQPQTISFTNGVWEGFITVSHPSPLLWLRADDLAGHSGDSASFAALEGPQVTVHLPPSGNESAAGFLGNGLISVPSALPTNLLITIAVDLPDEIKTMPNVFLPAGQTSVLFAVTNLDDLTLDGARVVAVTASAPGFSSGTSTITNNDDELAMLTLSIPSNVREGDGLLIATGKVAVNLVAGVNLVLNLSSSNTNELQVPPIAHIAAGSTSGVFSVTVVNDTNLDGPQSVTVNATLHSASTNAFVVVADNESTNILLAVVGSITEGAGIVSNAITLTLSGKATSNVVVALSSDIPSKLQVPPQLMIPAGQSAATTNYFVGDDIATNGSQVLQIIANASGFTGTTGTVTVLDNDPARLRVSAISPQFSGQPFLLTVYAETVEGNAANAYQGGGTLTARNDRGFVMVTPATIGPFSNGFWTGFVTIPSESPNTVITVFDNGGHSKESNPFDVVTSQVVSLPLSDLVYDGARGVLLAGSLSTQWINSVVSIDPVSGAISNPIALNNEPGKMALSDNAQYLYVGTDTTGGVARVNLDSKAIEHRFPLHPGSSLVVEEMRVAPNAPDTVVISRKDKSNGFHQGIGVYDNGVRRPKISDVASFCCGYSVGSFDSSLTFFSTYSYALQHLRIATNGLEVLQEAHGTQYGSEVVFSGGRLYSSAGRIFDPITLRLIGSFPVSGLVLPEPDKGVVFFLTQEGGQASIQAFADSTRLRIASMALPGFNGTPRKFLRTGLTGFACQSSSDQLFLVNTSFVLSNAVGSLGISLRNPPTNVYVGSVFTLSMTVSNASSISISNLILRETLQGPATLLSGLSASGACKLENNTVTCVVDVIPANATVTADIEVHASQPGLLTHQVSVVSIDGTGVVRSDAGVFFTSIGHHPGATNFTEYRVANTDMVYDVATGRIIVAIPRVGSLFAGGLVAFNPSTGDFGPLSPLMHEPAKVAIAPVGRHLYATLEDIWEVQPFDTVQHIMGVPFDLPRNTLVQDIAVHPVNPQTIAISSVYRTDPTTYSSLYAAIYDGGAQRAQTVHSPFIEFSVDGTLLYGTGPNGPNLPNTSGQAFYRNIVSATGLASAATRSLDYTFATDMRAASGLIFYENGWILDPVTLDFPGRFVTSGNPARVCVDDALQTVFFLSDIGSQWILESFDLATRRLKGRLSIPQLAGKSPNRLIRWGTDGLAVNTREEQLFVLRFTDIPSVPRLVLKQAFTPAAASVDDHVTYSVIVSNAGPGTADNVLLTDILPSGSSVIAATSPRGLGTMTNGSLLFNLGTLIGGESVTATIVVAPSLGGLVTNWTEAVATLYDDSGGENRSVLSHWLALTDEPSVMRAINLPAVDLAFDHLRQHVHVSVPSETALWSNAVVALNVKTGTVVNAVPIAEPPGRLALADNSEFLYVARTATGGVSRINLAAQAVDFTFGVYATDGPRHGTVGDMEVLPGQPHALAISILSGQENAGIGLFDDGVMRGSVGQPTEFGGVHPIGIGSSNMLYQATPFALRAFSITSTGLQFVSHTTGLVPSYEVQFELEGDLMYFETGRVVDPVGKAIVAQYPVGGLVAPDVINGRVYFLTQTGDPFSGPLLKVRSYEMTNHTELWSIDIPPGSGSALRFIRTGTNGLALATDASRLFLINTSLLEIPSADLTLQGTAAPTSTTVGGLMSFAYTIRNNGPWTASRVVFSNAVPIGMSFVSAHSAAGSCGLTNGSVVCSLENLANGNSAAVEVVLSGTVTGSFTNIASVSHSYSDSLPTDNVLVTPFGVGSQPSVSVYDAAAREGSVRSLISFSVKLSMPSPLQIRVNFFTSDGTAFSGNDYEPANGLVSFPPGSTNQTLTLFQSIHGNATVSSNRFFFVNLTNATNATLGRPQAVGTIIEDDFYRFSISGTSVVEGNTGNTNATFYVSLLPPSPNPVSITYETVNVTAADGSDYSNRSGSLYFSPGTTNIGLPVPVAGDEDHETDELFIVLLSQSEQSLLSINEATGRIINDDPEPVLGLLPPVRVGNGWFLRFTSSAGKSYRLQHSDTLNPNSWSTVADQIQGTGNLVEILDTVGVETQRFYRVQVLP